MHASIIDMTLRQPVDAMLFDELRTDFLPKASQHPGFHGFQFVLAEQGRAVGILWYEQPEDLDGITRLVGTWFHDHIAPRLAGPETAVSGRVVVNTTPSANQTDCPADSPSSTSATSDGFRSRGEPVLPDVGSPEQR